MAFPKGLYMGQSFFTSFSQNNGRNCQNKLRNSLKKLQLIQNAASGVLTRINEKCPITPMLAFVCWLPIKPRRA